MEILTLREAFKIRPLKDGEDRHEYCNQIRRLTQGKSSDESILRTHRKFYPAWQKKQETKLRGETHIEKFGIVPQDEIEDLTDYHPTKLTTNPYGGQWVRYEKKQVDYFQIREDIIKDMSKHSPNYRPIKREKQKDGNLLVIDPADIHIGKLAKAFETADEYNNEIAVNRVLSGVDGLINKSQGFKTEKILLIIGNDILHFDTPKRTTTSGTPQDTDGMWYTNFLMAKEMYVKVIETLLTVSDIDVHYNPSNHDYVQGFLLADTLATWFRKTKQITFNADISHRKYYRYFNNAIGTTHGDGAKDADLPFLMAQECRFFNECKHRYMYTHHIHHKKAKDYGSVCVESLRSPSGTDGWHHRNGFQHQPKAVEAFIHSKNDGQVARLTHIF